MRRHGVSALVVSSTRGPGLRMQTGWRRGSACVVLADAAVRTRG